MEDFCYTALPPHHIRLFSLQEDEAGRVLGSLVETPLAGVGDYIALSYAWGELSQLHEILCNGKVLRVHSNLYSCLQQLRSLKERRPLWIDALCIDQNSDKEKNHQIPMMMEIYETAIGVLIWLGEATEEEEEAVLRMSGITTTLEGLDLSHDLARRFDHWTSLGLPDSLDRVWAALRGLMERTWFERLWPLQEVAVAQSLIVLVGRKAVAWKIFIELYEALHNHGIDSIASRGIALGTHDAGMWQMWNLDVVRGDIYSSQLPQDLITIIRDKKVTNPVDKIYGVLGLLNLELEEPLKVDVTSNVVDVYTEFATHWVTQDAMLTLLSNTSAKERLDGLPSWCPNFSSEMLPAPLGVVAPWAGYHSGYSLEQDRTCHITLTPGSNCINAPGIDVDKVEEIIGLEYPSEDNFVDTCLILDWETACLSLSRKVYLCKGDQTIPEAHWRTLVADKYRLGLISHPQREGTTLLEEYLKWKRNLKGFLEAGRLQTPNYYTAAVDEASFGRRFFSTVGGRIGLGPLETQAGDSVCILYGGPTPYILRKEKDNNVYKLVGECYVHGLMYGEALEMRDQGLAKETSFTIM